MKNILNHLGTDWYKYLLELIVITAGVLGAFALNNWNEERKDRLYEKDFVQNLMFELRLDTAALAERMASHQRINDQLKITNDILYDDSPISKEQVARIGTSIPLLEVLTTVYKNIEKNDELIAGGVLESVNSELNNGYQRYLEQTKSNNAIVNKLGESLQRIVLKDVNPFVDLYYVDVEERRSTFDLQELRNSREFKNAINRSIYYRQVHINFSQEQINQATALLKYINEIEGITTK